MRMTAGRVVAYSRADVDAWLSAYPESERPRILNLAEAAVRG